MTDEAKFLDKVRENVEMGIDGINTVQKKVRDEELLALLSKQRAEYRDILAEANEMLHRSGAPVESGVTASQISAKMFTAAKTLTYSTDSEIAEDMIRGTSTGITKITRQINGGTGISPEAMSLAEKLVKTEQRNVDELKKFL